MYRILIADDEPLEREGMELIIKTMVKRDITIIHAENGREAVQKAIIFKPHITLMDIRMPGLDGLTAIKEIKQQLPHMKIVLVTAYEYFEYAREAIHLGVKDYLVKPTKRSEIATLIENLLKTIDADASKQQLIEQNNHKLIRFSELASKELALRLMDDQKDEVGIQALSELIAFEFEFCVAIVIAFQDYSEDLKTYEASIHHLLNHLLVKEVSSNIQFIYSPIINEHLAVFVSASDEFNSNTIFNDINKIALMFIQSVEQTLKLQAFIGVGNLQHNLSGIKRSYFEAVFASTNVNRKQPICMFNEIQERLAQPLQIENENNAAYVKKAIEKIRQERDDETHSMINRVSAYIQKNYNRELSLEEAAEYVHLNPYYFSKVFKQLTGETFIDYLTGVRISHAKKWMEQKELSLKEICYLVGYNDPNYLSRVFKKVVGQTPSEYRQTLH